MAASKQASKHTHTLASYPGSRWAHTRAQCSNASVGVASFPGLHRSYRRLQYEYTASDDSCGGGLGTRLSVGLAQARPNYS